MGSIILFTLMEHPDDKYLFLLTEAVKYHLCVRKISEVQNARL
jgi:hypothetical protein